MSKKIRKYNTSEAAEYVIKALEEGRLEDCSFQKRKLARELFSERPDLFRTVEQVRDFIRYNTGKRGEDLGKWAKFDFSNLPQFPRKEPKDIVISKATKRIGIINDAHIPHQDSKELNTALKELKERNIQELILNGDMIDCGYPSRWPKDHNTPDFTFELDALYEFCDALRNFFGDIPIYFKIGNHEDRIHKKLWDKMPELAREIDFFDIANLHEFSFIPVQSFDRIIFSDLSIYHGHEFKGGGELVAKNLFNKTKGVEHIAVGHHHCTQTWGQGMSKKTYSIGCLCRIPSNYDVSSRYRSNHGYAYVERKGDSFRFDNIWL